MCAAWAMSVKPPKTAYTLYSLDREAQFKQEGDLLSNDERTKCVQPKMQLARKIVRSGRLPRAGGRYRARSETSTSLWPAMNRRALMATLGSR